VASPGSSRGQSRSRLTIGELFPDGDVVGQWVFSLTSLTEDLHVGTQPAKQAQESGDVRGMLSWHRHMVTRLYEARRLITAARTIAEVDAFAGNLLHDPPGGANLMGAYTRPTAGVPSTVEGLYEDLRNVAVHYPKVGGAELRGTLRKHAYLPAHITIEEGLGGTPDLQFRWVQAIRSMEIFGDVHQPDFLAQMRARGEITGRIAASWMMVAGLAVILNARRLGIDTNKLGDISGWEPPGA
jgi:hypothetical protein